MSKRNGLILLLTILSFYFVSAQEFNTIIYTQDDGLPDNYVYSISRNNNGYLWIGTSSGLASFDGYSFEIISSEDSLQTNFITTQFIDDKGHLWLGHSDGSISKCNDKQNHIPLTQFEKLSKVCSITQDTVSEAILILTTNGKLITINHNDTSISDLGLQLPLRKMEYYNNKLYILNQDGIYTQNRKSYEIDKVVSDNVHDFFIDNDRNAIVFSTGTGVFSQSISSKGIVAIEFYTELLRPDDSKLCLQNEKIYILRKNKGISIFNLKSKQFNNYEFIKEVGIPMFDYQTIFVDNEDIIWLGTYGKGVVKVEFSVFNLIKTKFDYPISAIYKDSLGVVWLGVNHFLYNNHISTLTTEPFTKVLEINDKISTLSSDLNYDILIGTEESGMIIYNDSSKLTTRQNLSSGFFSNKVTNIYKDDFNNVWLASLDNGIVQVKPTGGSQHFNTSTRLIHNYIKSSFKDSKDRLWFSTFQTSLSFYDLNNLKFTILKPQAINFGLEINGICEDRDTNIWFATNGNGLLSFNNKEFSWYGRQEGSLQSNYSYSIFNDANNNLWISHKTGFSVFNPSENISISFNAQDGFPVGSTSTNSIIGINKTYSLAISDRNIVRINNSTIYKKHSPPSVQFKKILVNGEEQIKKSQLDLEYGEYTFDFNFVGISLKKGSPIQYMYKFKGVHDTWSELTENKHIKYGISNYGSYIFQVIAVDGYDQESGVLEYVINIEKPIYLKWWFILFSILVIIGLPVFYMSYRIRASEISRQLLEHKVRIRTKEIKNKSEEIEALNIQQEILIDNIPSAVYYKDLDLRYIQINNHYAELLGLEASEIIGKTDSDITSDEVKNEYETLNHQVISTKTPIYEYLKETILDNGSSRWVSTSVIPILDKNGNAEGVIGVVKNITAQIEYENRLKDSKAKIEKIHNDLSDNIGYAKSIQESLLTGNDIIDSYLSDYFILFNPKDQVSGDFYYVRKFNNHIIIAAADCTGHGVSGAFLTVLGITFLHDIVGREDIHDPGTALNRLRKKIKETYTAFGSERKDGLDIALCVLNTDTNELQYSGAFNPLWIVRNKQLLDFKATRNPIGFYPVEKAFEAHTIQLQKNDAFYIFSDGFADQFGGPKGKKLKYKPFKQLLVDNSEKPMKEQNQIFEDMFNQWKGTNEQVDDVTLIGVKV